ncbi:MAG: methyltransferase [Bacteroidales bacterium]|nr:methyltransferase [Bacteroidales bacterium]
MSKKSDKRPFHLKQFSLFHHQSSMKVGTDSLLLGIWTDLDGAAQVLDVGTGCGILALLAAARSNANVDAIELDETSFKEASGNFLNATFHKRLHAFHDDFNHFASDIDQKYDLIISNPPFFINDMRAKEKKRNDARHGDRLNYEGLCRGASALLKADGRFCLVLPYDESKIFIQIAKNYKLYVNRQLLIIPKRGLPPNRINLELSFYNTAVTSEEFVIREKDSTFTVQYIQFFKDHLIGYD